MSRNISYEMATPTLMASQTPVVGYRFHPTDQELIIDYLEPKNRGHDDGDRTIAVVEVCKTEPRDLPALSKIKSKDQAWFFLCPRHKNKKRKRSTKEGFWKPEGKPRPIKARRTKKLIGTKRTLVFHDGCSSKGTRTKWVMHEYELPQQGDFVLCKLKNKSDIKYGSVDANEVALPDEMISMSSHDIHKPSHLVYDKYQDTSVTTTTSDLAGDGSDLSFLNSPSENQLLSGTLATITHEIDESNNLMPSDFEYQNLDMQDGISENLGMQDGISATVEREGSPFMAMPSIDFVMQNQNENSDISSPDGLMLCDLESEDEHKVIPDLSAKLRAILDLMLDIEEELENSSAWMPTCSHQSLSQLLLLEQDFANCLLPQRP